MEKKSNFSGKITEEETVNMSNNNLSNITLVLLQKQYLFYEFS